MADVLSAFDLDDYDFPMGSPSMHDRKAEKNRKVLAAIDPVEDLDWFITVQFYIGLHRISSIVPDEIRNRKRVTHRDIHNYLSNPKNVPPDVWDAYKNLYDASQTARYWDGEESGWTPMPTPEQSAAWLEVVEQFVNRKRTE